MHHQSDRPALHTILPMLTCAVVMACGEDGPKSTYDPTALLANLTDTQLRPAVDIFSDDSKQFLSAVKGYCKVLGTAQEQAGLAAARAAWKQAMTTWQRVELMRVGPLVDNGGALADDIYSWPLVSACAVDQGVVKMLQETNFPVGKSLVNARGLDALEYLLFATSLDSQCAEMARPPGWDKRSDPDKRWARCIYASVVATDVSQRAATWAAAWDRADGDFGAQLKGAGSTSTAFASASAAEQALLDALFYLDHMTKDRKLGAPIGLFDNPCSAKDKCADALESRWAHHGKENVAANLDAFAALFTGGSGEGFDDHLVAVGATKLRDVLLVDIGLAQQAVAAIPGTIAGAIENDRDKVVAAHSAIKKLTDILKTQFVLAISLDLPKEADGDAD